MIQTVCMHPKHFLLMVFDVFSGTLLLYTGFSQDIDKLLIQVVWNGHREITFNITFVVCEVIFLYCSGNFD